MIVVFTVYGKPQGKARPRFTKSGRVYTPEKTREYENAIRKAYIAAANGYSFGNKPVGITIEIFDKKTRSDKSQYPTKKPDIDNIAKAIFDGLNGIAFNDDKQVVNCLIEKRFTAGNEVPRVTVSVWDL